MTPNNGTATPTRIHGLDALRGVLMMLGVLLHCALAYLPASDWPFVDWTASTPDLNLVTDGVHMFRMPAFFLLSGFFGGLLWRRRGARAMLKNRIERIVLPFAAFVLLLHPLITLCFGFGGGVKGHTDIPLDHALNEVMRKPLPAEGTMHLWFLYDLIFITAFAIAFATMMNRLGWRWPTLLSIVRRIMENTWFFLLGVGGFNFIWFAVFDWYSIPTDGQWAPENLLLLTYYLLWYGLGWLIFASGAKLSKCEDQAWLLVGMGAAATVARYALRTEHEAASVAPWAQGLYTGFWEFVGALPSEHGEFFQWSYWFLGSVALVAFTRGFMGLFLRYCANGTAIWRYLSDSSYWVYLIHLPLTVLVPALLLGWDVPVLIKYVVSVLIVLGVSWTIYDGVIRSTLVGKFLNGRKYPALHPRWSVIGTVLVVAWLGSGMVNFPSITERPPPWRNGLKPADLLKEEAVTYPVAPSGSIPDGITLGRCVGVRNYTLCADRVSPKDQVHACKALGYGVAIYETDDEQKAISHLASKLTTAPFWVGITDTEVEGEWRWPDGTPLTYEPWHEGEPNDWGGKEDCAALNWHGSVKWNDIGCDSRFGFICERSIETDKPAPKHLEKPSE